VLQDSSDGLIQQLCVAERLVDRAVEDMEERFALYPSVNKGPKRVRD
jgi:hypothetical protein